VFLASAGVGSWQIGNALCDFEAFDAADLDASAAPCAFTCVHYRYPFFFHVETLYSLCALLHDDGALHPRMWGTLEMYDSLLVKLLGKGSAGTKHGRGKLTFLSENAVRRADIRILEGH